MENCPDISTVTAVWLLHAVKHCDVSRLTSDALQNCYRHSFVHAPIKSVGHWQHDRMHAVMLEAAPVPAAVLCHQGLEISCGHSFR